MIGSTLLILACGILGALNVSNGIHAIKQGNASLGIIALIIGALCLSSVVRWAFAMKKIEKLLNSQKQE
jgi:hypothetical protein